MIAAADWFRKLIVPLLSPAARMRLAGRLHDARRSDAALAVLRGMLARGGRADAYDLSARIRLDLGRPEEALADWDEAIRLDSGRSAYWYSRAIACNDAGRLDEAARDFGEAIRRCRGAASFIHFELGNVQAKRGDMEAAARSFRAAVADPAASAPAFHYRYAQALEALGRDEEAADAIREAVRLQEQWSAMPDRGLAELQRRSDYSAASARAFVEEALAEHGYRVYESRLLQKLDRIDEALESIGRALADEPGSRVLLLRRAALLRAQGGLEEAERLLRQLLGGRPMWLPACMELVASYRGRRRADEAVDLLREAMAQYPEHPVVRYWLVDALKESGRSEQSWAESTALTELEPDDPLNWKQRAELAIDMNKYPEAEEAYSKGLALDDKAEYYLRRSFVRYMNDEYVGAMADIRTAAAKDASLLQDGRTRHAMGDLYAGMEQWELAEVEYTHALAFEPDNGYLFERRARCRLSAGKLNEALSDCSRGLALDEGNNRLLLLRGYVHFLLKDFDAALLDSLAYTQRMPQEAQGHYNLGVLYRKLNRHDDAIVALSKAAELNPFDAKPYLERASIWYHHGFDRARAADDLAQWLLYAQGESGDVGEMLEALSGFDDDMRERAKLRYENMLDGNRYLM